MTQDEDLRIVSDEAWQKVCERWREVDRVWPAARRRREAAGPQRSYVESNPPHLLAGLLRRAVCGATIGQVSGKSGGYYGCLAAVKAACDNRLLVRRTIAERCVLAAVRARISNAESLRYVLDRVAIEVKRLHAELPETLRTTHPKLDLAERRVANFIAFIDDGKGTHALGQALETSETELEQLRGELAALEAMATGGLHAAACRMDRRANAAAWGVAWPPDHALCAGAAPHPGPARLRPVRPEVGRPHYQIETALEVLDLLDVASEEAETSEGGSNWYQQWRRGELKDPTAFAPLPAPLILLRIP